MNNNYTKILKHKDKINIFNIEVEGYRVLFTSLIISFILFLFFLNINIYFSIFILITSFVLFVHLLQNYNNEVGNYTIIILFLEIFGRFYSINTKLERVNRKVIYKSKKQKISDQVYVLDYKKVYKEKNV